MAAPSGKASRARRASLLGAIDIPRIAAGPLLMDVNGTGHHPDGPWPRNDHELLAAWMKLQSLEYACLSHGAPVEKIPDSAYHGKMMVTSAFLAGDERIEVDDALRVNMRDASEDNPYVLSFTPDGAPLPAAGDEYKKIRVVGFDPADPSVLLVVPTEFSGETRDVLAPINAHLTQMVDENRPQYRRNVENFMPSIRYEPSGFLVFEHDSVLSRRLSGPVDDVGFTLFFVAKAYTTVGSSPWPVFTAVDSTSGWSYQVQCVIEQRSGKEDSFEPRWKVLCNMESEKTEGIDPTQFHIVTVTKTGRQMRLFIDGCPRSKPEAEFIITEDGGGNMNYILLGMDAGGSKYFDGEIAEVLAYGATLSDTQIDSVGRYLGRRYALPWDWRYDSSQTPALDEYLRTRRHQESHGISAGDAPVFMSAMQGYQPPARVSKVPTKKDNDEVKHLVDMLKVPEESLNAIEKLTQILNINRSLRPVVANLECWDPIFDLADSSQAGARTSAIRCLTAIFQDCPAGAKAFTEREGLFMLIRATEPRWKAALERQIEERRVAVDRAVEACAKLETHYKSLSDREMAKAFQVRAQIAQAKIQIEELQGALEAVTKRSTSGIEQSLNFQLQRAAVAAIGQLLEQDDESIEMFVSLKGVPMLSRVVESPSFPVQAAVCIVVGALVKEEISCNAIMAAGLLDKVISLMKCDDPPTQSRAAAVISRCMDHKRARVPLVKAGLLDVLYNMLQSKSDDNWMASCKIIYILATHDAAMRETLSNVDGLVASIVRISRHATKLLELRQKVFKCLAYLALNQTSAEAMWEHGFREVVNRAIKDPDLDLCMHALMALCNALRSEKAAQEFLEQEPDPDFQEEEDEQATPIDEFQAAIRRFDRAESDKAPLEKKIQLASFKKGKYLNLGAPSEDPLNTPKVAHGVGFDSSADSPTSKEGGSLAQSSMDSLGTTSSIRQISLLETVFQASERSEQGLEHLICGVMANLCVPRATQRWMLQQVILDLLVHYLEKGTFHAKYASCVAFRKLAWNAKNADIIAKTDALPHMCKIASVPRVLVDAPNPLGNASDGRSLYLHWQAGRSIAAMTISPNAHLGIVRAGGISSIIGLCESGVMKLCREGASSLAFLAEIRCETDCLLQMAAQGAIPALQGLAEHPDDQTGSEAIRALSSLLNFDSGWAE